jgi:hypothetical protein
VSKERRAKNSQKREGKGQEKIKVVQSFYKNKTKN